MKLDRNINPDKRGKYALIKMREIPKLDPQMRAAVETAMDNLHMWGVLDYGDVPGTDFFVIRLKDKYAEPALQAYALACCIDGEFEFGQEIVEMANKSKEYPIKQKPTPL
jgi:hypothetical protein